MKREEFVASLVVQGLELDHGSDIVRASPDLLEDVIGKAVDIADVLSERYPHIFEA